MGNTGNNVIPLVIFLLIFWGFLAAATNYFDIELTKSSIGNLVSENQDTTQESNVITSLINQISGLPVVKFFVPLVKFMSFQYTVINPYITIITDVLFLLSIVAVFVLIKP